MPILNYASEVRGTNEWPKLEILHLSACKYALGVKSSTTTDAVYAELGRYSVLSTRHINIIKFFLRLVNLESERYASKAFHMLSTDADAGHSNWISIARSLVSLYKIQNSDTTRDIKHKVNQHFRSAIMDSLKLHITQEKSSEPTLYLKLRLNSNLISILYQILRQGLALLNCALVHTVFKLKQEDMKLRKPLKKKGIVAIVKH